MRGSKCEDGDEKLPAVDGQDEEYERDWLPRLKLELVSMLRSIFRSSMLMPSSAQSSNLERLLAFGLSVILLGGLEELARNKRVS